MPWLRRKMVKARPQNDDPQSIKLTGPIKERRLKDFKECSSRGCRHALWLGHSTVKAGR